MPYRYDFVQGSQIIVVKWTDVLTAEGFIEFLRDLAANSDFRSNLNRLYDFRSATIALTSTGLLSIKTEVHKLDKEHGARCVAFLVHQDLAFGMLRMFTTIGDELKADMRVFRDEAEAKAWIGLPVEFKLPWDEPCSSDC